MTMPKQSYKGYYGIMKGIVTRTDNPTEMVKENDGRKKIQVYIPSYHGEKDDSKIGSGDDPGFYPWAQVCSGMFSGGSSNEASTGGFFQSIMSVLSGNSNNGSSSVEVMYPNVGDIVWLAFEDGDIRCPIYIGALSPNSDNQQNISNNGSNTSSGISLYTPNGTPLSEVILKMILDLSGVEYGDISNISSN